MRKWIKPSAWINSSQADEVANYYLNHSSMETAEHFGITKAQVDAVVKVRGISNGRNPNWYRRRNAELRLPERLKSMGFAYEGGYDGKYSKIKVRCLTCNTIYERRYDSFTKEGLKCKSCLQKERQLQAKKRKQIEANNAYVRKLENQWLRLLNPSKYDYEEIHEAFLDRQGVCEICGKPYIVRDYVKSVGLKYAVDNGVCSEKCKKKKKRIKDKKYRTENHRHRAKKYGVPYENGITLQKLIKRDGLICALCGKECNPNDHEWSKYTGPTHPSIDHIIPMAKGGGHTWDNVQVACMMCNSLKSDNI